MTAPTDRPGFELEFDERFTGATLDPDRRWRAGLTATVTWFLGDNDAGTPMWDPTTGGGYDGLQPTGPNLTPGAESTRALLSTLQHGRRLADVGPVGAISA